MSFFLQGGVYQGTKLHISWWRRWWLRTALNFHHLLLWCAEDDPSILDIMQCKTQKYTDHHIQNELLQILALCNLRKIAADMYDDSLHWNVMRSQIPETKTKWLCVSGGLMRSLSLMKSSIMFLTSHPLKTLARWRIQSFERTLICQCVKGNAMMKPPTWRK